MNWIIKEDAVMHKAENDIDVFKLVIVNLVGKIISMTVGFKYELGKLYSEELKVLGEMKCPYSDDVDLEVSGFSSYGQNLWSVYASEAQYHLRCNVRKFIQIGLLKSDDGLQVKVMKCKIPCGANYYVDEWGEFISDKLLPVELCEINYQVTK